MSRSEHTPSHHRVTGAHRAVTRVRRHSDPETLPGRPPAQYEPYLDGLFTYCLSVLCEHEAAVAALGDTLAVAERSHGRLRDPALRRPWLYAIARWACLRRFAEGGPAAGAPVAFREAASFRETAASRETAAERRRELAALAWPEAAGTTPEQREVIELAVRHQLTEAEIGAVLGVPTEAARSLLSRAACEVERTRTALAVVDAGGCPSVARLAGDTQLLLGTALRRELVRHVDECAVCRRTAERTVAAGPWPGNATPAVLPVLTAPLPATFAAMLHSLRVIRAGARDQRGAHCAVPYFDRRGFPLDGKARAARRALIRHRAVTTTVVAAVVAAPAIALWAAYRHAPQDDTAQGANSVSAKEAAGGDTYSYEKTGDSKSVTPGRGVNLSGRATASLQPSAAIPADGSTPSVEPGSPPPSATTPPGATPSPGPGWITVSAQPQGTDTLITVTNEGGSDVHWNASTTAPWLQLSLRSGDLKPGESISLTVVVDHTTEPSGPWRGRVVFNPSGSAVTIEGQGPPPPTTSPTPTPTPTPTAPAGT